MAFGEKECKVCGNKFNKIPNFLTRMCHENKNNGGALILGFFLFLFFGGSRRYCSKECAAKANESAANALKKEKTVLWRIRFFVFFWFIVINLFLDVLVIHRIFFNR